MTTIPFTPIIIAGSRTFTDYKFLEERCTEIIRMVQYNTGTKITIVSGKNPAGADKLGEDFARKHNFKVEPFPAKWSDLTELPQFIKLDKNNKPFNVLAGHNRNTRMAEFCKKHGGIAIVFNMGTKGATDMVKKAKQFGITVYEYKTNKEAIQLEFGEQHEF